jgi:hypothetical protein
MRNSSATLVRGAALIAAALTLAFAPVAASAQADSLLRPRAIEAMKRAYLECERAAIAGALDTGGTMSCSVLYEELKSEAFGGSFGALRRWYELEGVGREGTGV